MIFIIWEHIFKIVLLERHSTKLIRKYYKIDLQSQALMQNAIEHLGLYA